MSADAAAANLRRRRAASIAGYARAEQPRAQEARQRGSEARGEQLRGDSAWGRRLAAARTLKRHGVPPNTDGRIANLEKRLARLEARNEKDVGDQT